MRNPLKRPRPKLSAAKQKLLSVVDVEMGGHGLKRVRPGRETRVSVCVMELIGVMQHSVVTASPPCVSPIIRDLMINRNDYTTNDDERQKLKKLAADVIHTAPTRWLTEGELRHTERDSAGPIMPIKPDIQDPNYLELENARRERLDKWTEKKTRTGTGTIISVPYGDFARLVRDLADMGRFPARSRGKKPATL